MKNKVTVVKLGGNCMDNPELLQAFLTSFSKLEGHKVLVHGGGKAATELGTQLGVETKMIDGRRVTCADTLKIVTMVYAGLINKELVCKLQAINCNALGISGADGNLIQAVRRSTTPVDYGLAGNPIVVNADLLVEMITGGYTPVIAPITHDGSGQLLNTNADTVASFVAAALSEQYEVHLLFAFDKRGVLSNPKDDSSVIPQLSKSASELMKTENKIAGGMHPKLNAGFGALEKNVKRVTIQHLTTLESPAHSTTLVL